MTRICGWRPRARGGSWRPWRGWRRCRCARAWCATSRCARCRSPAPRSGPWNVVALAEPFAGGNCGLLKQLLVEVSGTTGLVMVGPRARRVAGPTVIAVEDADRLPSLLRAAERLTALDGAQIVLLLIAPDEEGLERMDGQVRLVVEAREDVRIETRGHGARARRPWSRRRCAGWSGGFVICQFGGLVVPDEGDLKPLASVLECPLFLVR